MARNKLWFDGFIFLFMFIDIIITLYVRFSLPGRTCAGEFLLMLPNVKTLRYYSFNSGKFNMYMPIIWVCVLPMLWLIDKTNVDRFQRAEDKE